MWKYKGVFTAGIIFSVLSIIYCMVININPQYKGSGVQPVFHDYPYIFSLCAIVISQFQIMMTDSYMFSRFSSLSKMLHYQVREMAIRLVIFLGILGVALLLLSIIYHQSYLNIAFLFYQLIVLFCIFMISFLFLITSYRSSFKRNSIICFFFSYCYGITNQFIWGRYTFIQYESIFNCQCI